MSKIVTEEEIHEEFKRAYDGRSEYGDAVNRVYPQYQAGRALGLSTEALLKFIIVRLQHDYTQLFEELKAMQKWSE